MAAQLLPIQLGFEVPRATEAAAHAARAFISGLQPGEGFLKLDFKNAFNIVRRDEMLRLVRDELPELYAFVECTFVQCIIISAGFRRSFAAVRRGISTR